MAWRKHRNVATDQVVPAISEPPFGGAEPLAMANPSTNGHVPAPNPGDDYWARALGKAHASPAAPQPALANHYRPVVNNQGASNVQAPSDDSAAGYWDRARGAAPRRPSLPERSSAVPPAAAVSVAPEALQDAQVTTEDAAVHSSALVASEPASVPTESLATAQAATTVRGAHARQDDPLAAPVRGSHVKADDPLAGAAWGAHLSEEDALAAEVRGAHVMADNPLARHAVAIPAVKAEALGAQDQTEMAKAAESDADASAGQDAQAKPRRRRWPLVPVAGAAAALAAGLGGGAAYAYFSSTGSGTGSATSGSAQGITVTAVASPVADPNLYPGGPAVAVNFTVNNPNPYAVSFTGWSGATLSTVTPVGANTCTTGDFQIAAASGTFGTALSIPANTASSPGVSGTANGVVQLTTTAENGCQGATVTVTLTLNGGQSS